MRQSDWDVNTANRCFRKGLVRLLDQLFSGAAHNLRKDKHKIDDECGDLKANQFLRRRAEEVEQHSEHTTRTLPYLAEGSPTVSGIATQSTVREYLTLKVK